MKKINQFTLSLLLLIGPFMLQAQVNPENTKEEKIQALEVAFISRKLNLTTEEAQKFWPVYNEYKKDMRQIVSVREQKGQTDIIDLEEQLIGVRKKYKDRFSDAIGKPRMNQFFKAEKEFRGVLMNRLNKQPGVKRPMRQRQKK
jgi:hypothetical protein